MVIKLLQKLVEITELLSLHMAMQGSKRWMLKVILQIAKLMEKKYHS